MNFNNEIILGLVKIYQICLAKYYFTELSHWNKLFSVITCPNFHEIITSGTKSYIKLYLQLNKIYIHVNKFYR